MRTIAELKGHAEALASAFGIVVLEQDDLDNGWALRLAGADVVIHAPVDSEENYIGQLHEFGHCVSPMGRAYPVSLVEVSCRSKAELTMMLERETAAWEWAEAMARQFGAWTTAMSDEAERCIASYRGHVA